jgi:UDP-glucose 4-epimerase
VARANYLAVKESIENQTLNVGTNSETSINKLAEIMKLKSGYSGEILYKEPRNGDIKNSRLDNTHFIGNTSWDIRYTLEEGMRSFFKKSKSI